MLELEQSFPAPIISKSSLTPSTAMSSADSLAFTTISL